MGLHCTLNEADCYIMWLQREGSHIWADTILWFSNQRPKLHHCLQQFRIKILIWPPSFATKFFTLRDHKFKSKQWHSHPWPEANKAILAVLSGWNGWHYSIPCQSERHLSIVSICKLINITAFSWLISGRGYFTEPILKDGWCRDGNLFV